MIVLLVILIATVLIFPLCYLLFAFVLGKMSGTTPFPASLIFNMGSIEKEKKIIQSLYQLVKLKSLELITLKSYI
jgi:hypothetical protein